MDVAKIEKGIPFINGRNKSNLKYPWHDMEVGDSFLFGNDVKDTAAYSAASIASKRCGKKFKTGRTDGRMRCWRIA